MYMILDDTCITAILDLGMYSTSDIAIPIDLRRNYESSMDLGITYTQHHVLLLQPTYDGSDGLHILIDREYDELRWSSILITPKVFGTNTGNEVCLDTIQHWIYSCANGHSL
jgi:hypothetical protein